MGYIKSDGSIIETKYIYDLKIDNKKIKSKKELIEILYKWHRLWYNNFDFIEERKFEITYNVDDYIDGFNAGEDYFDDIFADLMKQIDPDYSNGKLYDD